jgi:hypothetical protein
VAGTVVGLKALVNQGSLLTGARVNAMTSPIA